MYVSHLRCLFLVTLAALFLLYQHGQQALERVLAMHHPWTSDSLQNGLHDVEQLIFINGGVPYTNDTTHALQWRSSLARERDRKPDWDNIQQHLLTMSGRHAVLHDQPKTHTDQVVVHAPAERSGDRGDMDEQLLERACRLYGWIRTHQYYAQELARVEMPWDHKQQQQLWKAVTDLSPASFSHRTRLRFAQAVNEFALTGSYASYVGDATCTALDLFRRHFPVEQQKFVYARMQRPLNVIMKDRSCLLHQLLLLVVFGQWFHVRFSVDWFSEYVVSPYAWPNRHVLLQQHRRHALPRLPVVFRGLTQWFVVTGTTACTPCDSAPHALFVWTTVVLHCYDGTCEHLNDLRSFLRPFSLSTSSTELACQQLMEHVKANSST